MEAFLKRNNLLLSICFLVAQAILYYFILTASGDLLVGTSYAAILLCFLFALAHIRYGDRWIIGGLFFTAIADFFLVVCSPIQQFWGMVAFLGTQSLYAVRLHRQNPKAWLLYLRIGLTVAAGVVTAVVLKEKTDGLAVISVCYYVNLIANIFMSFLRFRQNKVFAIALVLFLLCDTVIGLQVACGAYLPIGENTLLYRIIFLPFNLSWLFYLPSQVLIALCSKRTQAA